jgi:hypothetical protein
VFFILVKTVYSPPPLAGVLDPTAHGWIGEVLASRKYTGRNAADAGPRKDWEKKRYLLGEEKTCFSP